MIVPNFKELKEMEKTKKTEKEKPEFPTSPEDIFRDPEKEGKVDYPAERQISRQKPVPLEHNKRENYLTLYDLEVLMSNKGYVLIKKETALDKVIKGIVKAGIKRYSLEDAEEIMKTSTLEQLRALKESEKEMTEKEQRKMDGENLFLLNESRLGDRIKIHFSG